MKKCPNCSEEIQDGAIVCSYCGRYLVQGPVAIQDMVSEPNGKKMSISQLLFSTKGRIPRSIYWYYSLVSFGIMVLFFLILSVVGMTFTSNPNMSGSIDFQYLLFNCMLMFFNVVFLAYSITILFVDIKRCHDLDWSGWYVLLNFIPLANFIFGIYLGFVKGTPGPNKYGPDPTQN